MARGKSNQVSKALEKALEDELKEVTRRWGPSDALPEGKKEGDFVYGALERMRILDRCIKLESLKLKQDDPGFGSEFTK